jgi:hypothetical protein
VSPSGKWSHPFIWVIPGYASCLAKGIWRWFSLDPRFPGERAAGEAGIRRPGEADRIRYGLAAAARRNPLTIPADRVPKLVRQALYAELPEDGPLEPEVVDAVIERLLGAIQQHLTEPAAAFNAWFSGGNNSFVRQVAQRKLLPGGRFDLRVVRRVRLDLGWRAYRYVGDCVHTTLRVFEGLMPGPLTEAERRPFERTYLKQAAFGDLPLALLSERFPFVKAILSDLLDSPDNREAVTVFHRLLDWYGDMARRRRDVDRTVKERRPVRRPEGEKTPLTVPLPECAAAAETDEAAEPGDVGSGEPGTQDPDPLLDLFADVAEQVCQERQLRCPCGLQDWRHRPVAHDGVAVTVEHACEACQSTAQSTVPVERFRQALGGGAG